ncbi:MFS transporter [Devosia neptuniae]|jgi:MFS family permease|uniref:MFS transporter n=1 Tax=Devosia TaxID=46913 RepID=UPI0022AE9A8A|nr:MFS transporter [Devosia neptuniae]MCZ4346875.1 MFS transporter [Devosia neptuniae]|tara:strand:- start:4409 stop:5599 length:1191 start_codon:yes stop_codon:yes gene_type:complete
MSFLTAQRLTMLVFFLQPIAFGSWLVRIPEVQTALGLGPAGLAVALLGLPCGTLLTLPFAGPLVGRIGARAAILVGFVLYSMAMVLPAFASDATLLFVALMLIGSSMSFVELGLNVQADAVEKATGSMIMTTSHGFWSVGIMAGSLIGSALAALGLEARWAIALVSTLVLPLSIVVALALPVYAESSESGEGKRSAWALPSWALLGICFFVFGITMTEGAMADWSAIFLRDALGAEAGTMGLGYSVFALMVAAGRFGGDTLKRRFGAVTTARICGVLALTGAAILFVTPNTALALIGFGVIGLGVSVGFPLAVTAAAGLTDRAASANVAILSFVALLGFLVGPPVIGFVAEHADIRLGVACVVPALLVSLMLTGRLATKKPAKTNHNPEADIAGVL